MRCTRQYDSTQSFWAQAPRQTGNTWTNVIDTIRRGGTNEEVWRQQAAEEREVVAAGRQTRRLRMSDFDSLSAVAQAA